MKLMRRHFAVAAGVAIGSMIAGAWLEYAIIGMPPLLTADAKSLRPDGALPKSGTQDLVVFIGFKGCAASNAQGLENAVRRRIDSLRVAADSIGHSFSTVGVSLDPPDKNGLAWLKRFGVFDEIVVGRNWLNSGVVNYIWTDESAPKALPQMLLIRHDIQRSERGIAVGPNSLVRRWFGAADILGVSNSTGKPAFSVPSRATSGQ